MNTIRRIAGFCLLICIASALRAADPAPLQPLKMKDVLAWKRIGGAVVSNDGQWFAYVLAPNEGDAEVVLHQTQGDKERRFSCGEGFSNPVFSHDSKWLAFSVRPTA